MRLVLRGERIDSDRISVLEPDNTPSDRAVQAIDLRDDDVDGDELVRAVRGEAVAGIDLSCADAGPIHEHIGHIRPGRTVSLRPALAAAARSIGYTAPQDDQLADVRARLTALSLPSIDLTTAKKRVASAGAEEARLREDVAAARGRLEVLRDTDADTDAVAAAKRGLRTAVERLAQVETDRIAAEQRLAQVWSDAHDVRTARQRRLELQDEIGNLERAARTHLVEAVYDEFRTGIHRVPGDAIPGSGPSTYVGEPVTTLLALARLSDVRAPLVLDIDDRFPNAAAAADCLGVSVLRL